MPTSAGQAPETLNKHAGTDEYMSRGDHLRLAMYKLIPDAFSNYKGKLLVDSYLKSPVASGGAKDSSRARLANRILKSPGTATALYNYLNGKGSSRVPDMVEHHFGGHWYAKPAKWMTHIPFVKNIAIDKILDKSLPRIGGDTSLAKQYLMAGGQV